MTDYVTECLVWNPEATMWTADGMGDRKSGGRGFRAGRTRLSAAHNVDAEEDLDDFALPDPHWVLRPVSPGHVLDDSKAGRGGVTCKTATGLVVKGVMGASGFTPVVFSTDCHFAVADRSCSLVTMHVECAQKTSVWFGEESTAMFERVSEIRGCEYLRIIACPVSVGSLKPAITVQTAVGPLLTFSKDAFFDVGAVQEKAVEDFGIEFPDDLMPEPAEGGSLDKALKARAPSLLCSAPGESLDTAKVLLIRFDGKEDAEIIQADAAARGKGEVPRSLPVMDFLVEPLSEDVFVDVTPAIVVSNAGDDCDCDEFETDDVCYSVREVCISFGVVAWSANMEMVGNPRHPGLPCFGVLSSEYQHHVMPLRTPGCRIHGLLVVVLKCMLVLCLASERG